MWRNVGGGDADAPAAMGNWLAVRLRQPAPNVDAVGAWVEVRVGDRTRVREVTVGGGHAGGQARLDPRRSRRRGRGRGPGPVARRRGRPVDDGGSRRSSAIIERGAPDGDAVGARGGAMTTTVTSDGPGSPTSSCRTSGCRRREPLLPPSIYAERLERLRARMDGAALRPPRRVGRSGAQRQPRLPHRVRPAVRGGGADRRERAAIRRSSSATSATAVAEAAPLPMRLRPLPGPQPARPAPRRLGAAARDPPAPRASRPAAGSASSAGRRTPSRATDRGAGLPRRRAALADRRGWPRRERHRPAHRRRRRAARHQRGRAAGGVRVGGVPDVARRAQPRSPACARA